MKMKLTPMKAVIGIGAAVLGLQVFSMRGCNIARGVAERFGGGSGERSMRSGVYDRPRARSRYADEEYEYHNPSWPVEEEFEDGSREIFRRQQHRQADRARGAERKADRDLVYQLFQSNTQDDLRWQ